MRKVKYTAKFKKDAQRIKKRGFDFTLLNTVLDILLCEGQLPQKYQDHLLAGEYKNHRECHIAPDWLLIYRISDDDLILTAVRTGSHSDLF